MSDSTLTQNQKVGREVSTKQRNTEKEGLSKKGKWFSGILLTLIFVPLIQSEWSEYSAKKEILKAELKKSEANKTEQKSKTTTATWDGVTEGASIPVGVWSSVFSIGVGCKTDYDAGNGTDFKVRYRFYSPEWKDHPGGENYPPANEVQFMLLKPRSVVPVKVTCS